MGHINYDFKLGQIISKPTNAEGLYTDPFIDAYPINSTKVLSEGLPDQPDRYSYFLSFYISSMAQSYKVREYVFSPRTWESSKYELYNSIIDNLSLENGVSLAVGWDGSSGGKWDRTKLYNYTRCTLYIDTNNSTSGHTHSYLPATAKEQAVYILTDTEGTEADGWVTLPKVGLPTKYALSVPSTPAAINYTYKGFGINYGRNDPSYNDSNVGFFALSNTSAIVDRTTGTPISYITYNQLDNPLTDENWHFAPAYYQEALGTNMLLVVSVNRNVFEQADLDYVRGLVGKTFMGIFNIDFYERSVSLEIVALDADKVISRADYPEFFSIYGIVDDTFKIKNLMKRPSGFNSDENLNLCNAKIKDDVGIAKYMEFSQDLADTVDTYLPHSSKFLMRQPPQIKVAKGSTPFNNLEYGETLKETFPTRVLSDSTTDIPIYKNTDTIRFGTFRSDSSTNFSNGGSGMSLAHVTYIILKSKI